MWSDVLGPDHPAIALLSATRAVMLHSLREEAFAEPVFSGFDGLLAYLHADMAHDREERLRALFLNSRNQLISDETLIRGTIDQVPIFPREVVRRALDLGSAAIILIHNHPSGDPRPSNRDIAATRAIAQAAALFDIMLHDHIIIARDGAISLRREGLL